MREIIAPTTAGVAQDQTIIDAPATFMADALAGSEVVDIYMLDSAGTAVLVTLGGAPAQLTESEPSLTAYAPGTYRLVKSATASAVRVSVASKEFGVA